VARRFYVTGRTGEAAWASRPDRERDGRGVATGPVEGASYTTLEGVLAIFDVPGAALGGWVHFLAFDLVVGAWIARTARAEAVPFGFVAPCLLFCFLVGRVGFILFLGLRRWRRAV